MHDWTLLEDGATLRLRGADEPLEDAAWAREQAGAVPPGALPVVLGAGRGELLRLLAQSGFADVAVLDAESGLLAATGALDGAGPGVAHVDQAEAEAALEALANWRRERGSARLCVLPNPAYLRLNPRLYAAVARALRAPTAVLASGGAPSKAPARAGRAPKLLLLRFGFFLERELCAALSTLGADYAVYRPKGQAAREGPEYVRGLWEAIRVERPDAILTVNMLGVDPGGALTELLERLRLPLAVWFVDSPELILHGAGTPPSPCLVPFTCDPDGPDKLAALGIGGARLLPLACDATRLAPAAPLPKPQIRFAASFVGTTWVDKLGQAHRNFRFPAPVLRGVGAVAEDLAARRPTGPLVRVLERDHPGFAAHLAALPPPDQGGALHLACWEGNRRYRLARVRALLPAAPLIVGDRHWARLLGPDAARATLHPPLSYYGPDLPGLYAASAVNLTCGGVQMPRAANQRHFDVPAAGGLLLSDRSDQALALFDPETEIACYDGPEEIAPLAERYARDRRAARRIVAAARTRIAAEHTYAHRVRAILDALRDR